jgi:hypothetical protein
MISFISRNIFILYIYIYIYIRRLWTSKNGVSLERMIHRTKQTIRNHIFKILSIFHSFIDFRFVTTVSMFIINIEFLHAPMFHSWKKKFDTRFSSDVNCIINYPRRWRRIPLSNQTILVEF